MVMISMTSSVLCRRHKRGVFIFTCGMWASSKSPLLLTFFGLVSFLYSPGTLIP